MQQPIYIFDFDGVICDSAVETCITGWKASQKLWQDMPEPPSEKVIDQFRAVRPYLETGYEAILIVCLLYRNQSQGKSTYYCQHLCQHYEQSMAELIQHENLKTNELKQLFGETRDHWISTNEEEWLAMNPLFSTAVEKLKQLQDSVWYILTTKQERFVKRILNANHIHIEDKQLFGLDKKMSKQDSLLMLQNKHPDQPLIFIEDRIQTLLGVQNNQLLQASDNLELQLVTWGYNSPEDRQLAQKNKITLISTFD
jgi:phosphoglycolate phosphatase-like HAD superfamily hydrolase